ncbi:MAG: hypothetical protein V3T65_07905 [Acidobacteriota bacterium]
MANCKLWRNFLLSGLLGAFLLAGASFVHADDQTLVGVVSNTHCGLKHSTADASGAGCVNACVNAGRGTYALVVDGSKIYQLEGGTADLKKLAGLEAKVTGNVDGMTMHVASVVAGS